MVNVLRDASLTFEATPKHDSRHSLQWRDKQSRRALIALLVMMTMVSLSFRLMNLPLNRILELRYCRDYYRHHDPLKISSDGDIPESDCKVRAIQQSLAKLMGAFETAVMAADLAVAAPLGYISDRIGPRLVLFLNATSMAILISWVTIISQVNSISTWWILAGPVLALFGGGTNVFKAITVSLMSNLSKTDNERTARIAYLLSTEYITMLLGPTLAATTMIYGLWLPLWTGVTLTVMTLPLVGFLPVQRLSAADSISRSAPPPVPSEEQERTPLLSTHSSVGITGTSIPESSTQSSVQNSNPALGFLKQYYEVLRCSQGFQLLLVIKFLSAFASSSTSITAIYLTFRTGLTYVQVGYIYTIKAGFNVLLSAIMLPAAARHWSGQGTPNTNACVSFNMVGSRLALMVSSIGAAFIGLSPTSSTMIASLFIYALGSTLPTFLFSIARSPELSALHSDNEGSGFTIMVLVSAVGSLVGVPVMAIVWVQAIDIGGIGIGLPFFTSAGAYLLAFILMLFVRTTYK